MSAPAITRSNNSSPRSSRNNVLSNANTPVSPTPNNFLIHSHLQSSSPQALNFSVNNSSSSSQSLFSATSNSSSSSSTSSAQMNADEQFFSAAESGNRSQVRQLLNSGVNIDSTDHNGRTALMLAALYGKKDVLKLLIARRANSNLTDSFSANALAYAAGERDPLSVNKFDAQRLVKQTTRNKLVEALLDSMITKEQVNQNIHNSYNLIYPKFQTGYLKKILNKRLNELE